MEYTISYKLYTGYLFTPLSNKNMFINNNKKLEILNTSGKMK